MSIVKNETIKQYLLNTLSETDRIRFEIQYFEDDDLFQRLRMIEEELITDYVYDRLTAAERRLFDEHYSVTPERRERIEMARNWKRVASDACREQLMEPLS
ncbi:MAG: hypothetical protein L0220_33050 [Acidobacteria bacterium]|nr:hypothetical protein [Acidobacteriota bacterium]